MLKLRIYIGVLLFLLCHTALFSQSGLNKREAMWLPEIRAFQKSDSAVASVKGQILFTGSSSIKMWQDVGSYFPGYAIVHRGVGGSHLEDIIYFAEQIIFPYQPRQIVLYEGDNDIKDGFTPQSYLDEVRVFVRLVHIRQPQTPIVILSVKPSPARDNLRSKYTEANRLLKEYAASTDYVTFVDITPTVIAPDGKYIYEGFMSDKLHITKQTYKAWAEIIKPHLIK